MDEFLLQIDASIFRQTNAPWNELCLNDPWSVGYVSALIESRTFVCKEEWEAFYYNSGQERMKRMQQLSSEEQQLLNDHTLKHTHPQLIATLGWHLKNLNFYLGRTEEQLHKKGQLLYEYVTQKKRIISLAACAECVRYRTICETWNGIIIRERNTINTLKEILPALEFIKTSGEFDHQYAVDYELSENGKVFCGIQIKPLSYASNAPYVVKARNANSRKNQHYTNSFHRPVFDVIARANGTIENAAVINHIKATKR